LARAFGSLAEKVADYEALLKDLCTRVGEEDANAIKALLEKVRVVLTWPCVHFLTLHQDVVSGYGDSPRNADASQEVDGVSEDTGEESETSAGVGSIGAVDRIEEDFNRSQGARTTGYMGKNSEVTWLQKLRQENTFGSPVGPASEAEFRNKTGGASPLFEKRSPGSESTKTLPDAFEGFSAHDLSYHLDDFSISIPEAIDRFEIPPRETADHLFNAYLESVHPSFPIIGKMTFSSQYRKFMEGTSASPGERWLAILNMIFAIGARYAHLVQAEWRGDERDHLLYFSRARLLSLNGNTIFNHPDLQQVQVSALIAFYLLATSQINR
jgi:Fungal specific transcription factor domain